MISVCNDAWSVKAQAAVVFAFPDLCEPRCSFRMLPLLRESQIAAPRIALGVSSGCRVQIFNPGKRSEVAADQHRLEVGSELLLPLGGDPESELEVPVNIARYTDASFRHWEMIAASRSGVPALPGWLVPILGLRHGRNPGCLVNGSRRSRLRRYPASCPSGPGPCAGPDQIGRSRHRPRPGLRRSP